MAFEDFDTMVMEFMIDYPMTALITRTTGEYDPSAGLTVPLVKTFPVEAIMLDYTLRSNGLGVDPNTDIMAGDKHLIVRPPNKTNPGSAPVKIDPTTDNVTVGKTVYRVLNVKEINPNGVDVILYELQLRR